MRTILSALGLAGIAVTAAACLGVAAPAGSSAHGVFPPPAAPKTRVVVRVWVGRPEHSRRAVLSRCPALARCRIERAPSSHLWALVASRTLTCAPAAGGYRHPAAACRALLDLSRLEAHRGPQMCMCRVELVPPATALGWIDHRRVRIDLGGCAVCGMTRQAQADAGILLAA